MKSLFSIVNIISPLAFHVSKDGCLRGLADRRQKSFCHCLVTVSDHFSLEKVREREVGTRKFLACVLVHRFIFAERFPLTHIFGVSVSANDIAVMAAVFCRRIFSVCETQDREAL